MRQKIHDIIEMMVFKSQSTYFGEKYKLENDVLPKDLKSAWDVLTPEPLQNAIKALSDKKLVEFSSDLLSSDIVNKRWQDNKLKFSCGIEPKSKELLEGCGLYDDYIELMKSRVIKDFSKEEIAILLKNQVFQPDPNLSGKDNKIAKEYYKKTFSLFKKFELIIEGNIKIEREKEIASQSWVKRLQETAPGPQQHECEKIF